MYNKCGQQKRVAKDGATLLRAVQINLFKNITQFSILNKGNNTRQLILSINQVSQAHKQSIDDSLAESNFYMKVSFNLHPLLTGRTGMATFFFTSSRLLFHHISMFPQPK